jgi:hypothetical protein
MKKAISSIVLLIVLSVSNIYSQVSKADREKMIEIYTLYAEAKTGTEALEYIRNPEDHRKIFYERYATGKNFYTPIRFGNCLLASQTKGIYALEEYVSANRGTQNIEILQYRYFLKIKNQFKIDWDASVCYNEMTFPRFIALKDGKEVNMRCYATLVDSTYDNYFAFGIRDNLTNYQFTAYTKNDSDLGIELLEYLENGDTRPVILRLKYTNDLSRYSKNVFITEFVNMGWIVENEL